MIKRTVLLLAYAACVASVFPLLGSEETDAPHWVLADPICAGLGVYCAVMVILGKWRLDAPAGWMMAYLVLFGLTGALHYSSLTGTFFGFGQTATYTLVLYLTAMNTVRTPKDLKLTWAYSAATSCVFVIVPVISLYQTWTDRFTNVVVLIGNLGNMNAWGFVLVILFCPILLAWLSSVRLAWLSSVRSVGWLFILMSVLVGIGLSLSRGAYIGVTLISVLLLKGGSRTGRWTRALSLCVVAGVAIIALREIIVVQPDAAQFLSRKADSYSTDIYENRLYAANLTPMSAWLVEPLDVIVIGDGVSYQHSLLSNTLYMTGLTGVVVMVLYHMAMWKTAVSLWRNKAALSDFQCNPGSILMGLVVAMLLNDLSTNLRFHSPTVGYLFGVTAGALVGYARELRCVQRIPGCSSSVGRSRQPAERSSEPLFARRLE
jgi:hypothetical protein